MGKYASEEKPKDPSSHKDAADFLDKIQKLDELNPMEQAIKYKAVKRNPPEPGYMQVDVFKVEGEDKVVSKSTKKNLEEDPFFSVDLNTAIMANIAACPSNVIPMLIEQARHLSWEKVKTFKPEKRGFDFNWWWIVFILLVIAPVVVVIFSFI